MQFDFVAIIDLIKFNLDGEPAIKRLTALIPSLRSTVEDSMKDPVSLFIC